MEKRKMDYVVRLFLVRTQNVHGVHLLFVCCRVRAERLIKEGFAVTLGDGIKEDAGTYGKFRVCIPAMLWRTMPRMSFIFKPMRSKESLWLNLFLAVVL